MDNADIIISKAVNVLQIEIEGIETLKKQLDKLIGLTGNSDIAFSAGVMACKNEDLRSWRELLTYALKGIAAYAEHAAVLGKEDESIYQFFFSYFSIFNINF